MLLNFSKIFLWIFKKFNFQESSKDDNKNQIDQQEIANYSLNAGIIIGHKYIVRY